MMRTIGDYHIQVIARATVVMQSSKVTLAAIRELRALLEHGETFPATDPVFGLVRERLGEFIAAYDALAWGRAINIPPPEPETERLREAVLAFCRRGMGMAKL